MPIVLRNSKNSALTHAELDGNFTDLDTRVNSKADSSTITSIIDAAYIQARQVDLQRDSAFITNIVSETYVTNFIDSAYIQERQVDLQRDSAFVTDIVDSAYVQTLQNTYNNTSVDNHLNVPTATSGQVLSWTGADYDWINQTSGTGGGIDSAAVIDIISTQDINDLNHNLETLPVSAPGGFDQPVHGTIMVYDVDTTDGNMFRYQTVQGAVQNALNIDGNSTNKVLGWNGSTFIWEVDSSSSLTNIQDETYGVSVTGKMAISTIDIGSGINASPGATFDLQGTTINFGSANIMGGNAFNDDIDQHLWSGATQPTHGYVLSWDSSALSGSGDYSWVAQTADTLQDVTTRGATTTDLVDFQAGMTVGGADLHILNHGILEQLVQVNNPTGVVTYDCNATNVWWNIQPVADWTANFININVPLNSARNLTLAIIQESQPAIPSAVQIMGIPQTIRWQGGTPPTGTANGIDVVSFSIIVIGATYHVLGQLVDFS